MRECLVFCGRFQPFHKGHVRVIEKALGSAIEVVVVVGSSFAPRTLRNPFTFEERRDMIRSVFDTDRVKIVGVLDYPYDDNKWIAAVHRAVASVTNATDIGLIGHSKDESSYYLNIFPKWKNHVEVENFEGINATEIRNGLLRDIPFNSRYIPMSVHKVLARIIADGPDGYNDEWINLRKEYRDIEKYKQSWSSAPFPPIFVTVDAVVVKSGHVLLVKRKDNPGRGLWALPGGFLNQKETLENGCLRELYEETKLKVPKEVLRGSIKGQHTFDAPNRSMRGRTITQAFFINLGSGSLDKVKGSDDAEKAEWVPIANLKSSMFYEDHIHIIDHFVGGVVQ